MKAEIKHPMENIVVEYDLTKIVLVDGDGERMSLAEFIKITTTGLSKLLDRIETLEKTNGRLL